MRDDHGIPENVVGRNKMVLKPCRRVRTFMTYLALISSGINPKQGAYNSRQVICTRCHLAPGQPSLRLTIAVFVAIFIFGDSPVWAAGPHADINQTVPPPTEQPAPPPSPEPTPRPEDNDNNNDDNPPPPAPPPTNEAAPPPVVATNSTGLTATVRAVAINVRQGPGVTFPIIGKLASGNTVSLLGRNQAGTWWNICCLPGSETPGWVSAQLMTPAFTADQAAALPITDGTAATTTEPPPATPQPEASPTDVPTEVPPVDAAPPAPTATLVPGSQAGTVTAVNLNVRGGPGTTFAVIGKVKRGDTVSVLGRNANGAWLAICCLLGTETNGWVAARFISPAFLPADLPIIEPTVTP